MRRARPLGSIVRVAESAAALEQTGERHVFLEAVLYPYRSLSRRGFVMLMAALAGASLAAGVTCIAVGAWPIFGFFGLDVARLSRISRELSQCGAA